LRDLPKAEVHAHLEGCFEPGVLEQWAAQVGVPMPRPRERLFEFEGLADFLHFLDWACGLASTRDRLAELSYGYARRLADNGAGYADVIVNPTHWNAWHGRLPAMIDAIDAGFAAAEQDGLPAVGLCISLLRTQSADAAAEVVDTLVALRHPRVGGALDRRQRSRGRAHRRPVRGRVPARRGCGAAPHRARRRVQRPEGVRDAIELLGADRIDHGVRAIQDPDLVRLLVDRQIPLGICPTSNLRLNVYPRIEDHPIEPPAPRRRQGVHQHRRSGAAGRQPGRRVRLVQRCVRLDDDTLQTLARNSIEASFANADVKARLTEALSRWAETS
jgi:adenosine deaminase